MSSDREQPVQVHMRFSTDLTNRLDLHRRRLAQATPGFVPTRADAIRILLESALREAERVTVPADADFLRAAEAVHDPDAAF